MAGAVAHRKSKNLKYDTQIKNEKGPGAERNTKRNN